MKKVVALLLVALLAVAAFGCAAAPQTDDQPTQAPTATDAGAVNTDDAGDDQPDAPVAGEEVVTVCYMGPLSGAYASYGQLNMAGIQAYVAMFEENGGFANHPEWKLNMRYEDHELNAEVAMSLFERLAAEVDVFMFSTSTMAVIACQPLCIKYEKPLFTVTILADRALEENNPWTFRVVCGDKDIAATHGVFLEFLKNNYDFKMDTYAMVYTSDDYGLGLPNSYGKGAADLGAECVLEEVIQYGQTTDLSGVVSKIRQAKPDVLLVSCTALEAGMLSKTLKQFDVHTPMITAGSGFSDPAFFEAIGANGADGTLACQTYIPELVDYGPEPDLAKQWIAKAEEMAGETWTEMHVHGWIVIGVVLAGIDEADALDGQSLLAAYNNLDLPQDHNFNWYTLYAGCKFGEKDGRYNQNIHATCIYGQIQNDTYRLIYNPSMEIAADVNPLVWPIQSWQTADWATASAAA